MALFSRKKEVKEDTQYQVSSASAKASPFVKTSGDKSADKSDSPKAVSVPKIPTVLVQPRISEKAGRQAAMNKYAFLVKLSANKVEVKKAVETFYKVKVTQVNIIRNLGKVRNFGNRKGVTSAFKKAIVTLRKGDKIEGLTDVV